MTQTFNREIIQEFKGKINDIEVLDEEIYYSAGFLLDCLVEHKIKFNDEVIRELIETMTRVRDKGFYSLGELEGEIYYAIVEDRTFPQGYGLGDMFKPANKILKELQKYE